MRDTGLQGLQNIGQITNVMSDTYRKKIKKKKCNNEIGDR